MSFEGLDPAETRKIALRMALRRLGTKEYSSAEMLSYLKRREVPEELAGEIVRVLVKDRMIDDLRYAKILVRSQAMRGKGPLYISNKLKQKGVKLDVSSIREWVAEALGTTEVEAARDIIERRYPDAANDPKAAARAFQALLRRGFTSDVARQALFRKGEPR